MGKKFTYEYVKKFFEEQGCEMLDKEYIDVKTKINYKCSCGNVSRIIFSNFRVGKRCKKCKSDRISKKLRLDYKDDYKYIFLIQHEYIQAYHKFYPF